MTEGRLDELVDASWAWSLGCEVDLLRRPGVHLVPGGPGFTGYEAVFMARFDETVLVYCPERLRPAALEVLRQTPAGDVFTVEACTRIAGGRLQAVLGPAWHGFVDDRLFTPSARLLGDQVTLDDERLPALRAACGEPEWAEAGFLSREGLVYAVEVKGQVVAAGNMTPFRGRPADVGLITHPDHRGRGLATALASRMIADALPDAGIVRYRARVTNRPSITVARSLGFVARGENLIARLR